MAVESNGIVYRNAYCTFIDSLCTWNVQPFGAGCYVQASKSGDEKTQWPQPFYGQQEIIKKPSTRRFLLQFDVKYNKFVLHLQFGQQVPNVRASSSVFDYESHVFHYFPFFPIGPTSVIKSYKRTYIYRLYRVSFLRHRIPTWYSADRYLAPAGFYAKWISRIGFIEAE